MPNIGTVLREEISRLSRRESRSQVDATKKATAQHRRDIAALKRQVAQLQRQVTLLSRKVLARIFHTEAQYEVGGIITSHVESVVKTDHRGDSADAKLYRDPSAVCDARTARN
jgi:hypothetical protein